MFKDSIHEYFTRCARTSSEHLNVLESINSLSVLTPRPHSLTLSLPFCLSLCFCLSSNGHTQGHPFKEPPHPATAVPRGAYVQTMLPGIKVWDRRESQWALLRLPLWWWGSIALPLTPTLCFARVWWWRLVWEKLWRMESFSTGLIMILSTCIRLFVASYSYKKSFKSISY